MINNYDEFCKKMIDACELFWDRYGQPNEYEILRLNSNDEINILRKEYLDFVYECGNEKLKELSYELLPEWIVFPYLPMESIGWRMGVGEDYAHILGEYLRTFTDEERIDYVKKYPEPYYFDGEIIYEGFDYSEYYSLYGKRKEEVEYNFYDLKEEKEILIKKKYFEFNNLDWEHKQKEIDRIRFGIADTDVARDLGYSIMVDDSINNLPLWDEEGKVIEENINEYRRLRHERRKTIVLNSYKVNNV